MLNHQAAQYLERCSKLLTEKRVRIPIDLFVSELDDTNTALTQISLIIFNFRFFILFYKLRVKIGYAFAFADELLKSKVVHIK